MIKDTLDEVRLDRKLNILLWHGYLLGDTGSNIYVQNLSRQLCFLGHDVYLFCQDAKAISYDFVGETWRFNEKNDRAEQTGSKDCPAYKGKCRVYQPNIGAVLPVYVLDRYEGFIAKRFLDLSEEELRRYVESNKQALEWLVDNVRIDLIEAGHAVMAPFIVAETAAADSIPFFVVIHGSDIEFTIRPSQRFRKYAADGFERADAVITITKHVAATVNELFGTVFNSKLKLIPPGVEVDKFLPVTDKRKTLESLLQSCERELKDKRNGFSRELQGKMIESTRAEDISADYLAEIHSTYNDRDPDRDLMEKLASFSVEDPLIVFVGKLMTTKGIHLALAAMPLILKEKPAAKLIVVGFGELREYLELLTGAMAGGDIGSVTAVADIIDAAVEGPPFLGNFYKSLTESGEIDDYLASAAVLKEAVIFTGILFHEQTRFLLPLADVQLVLSIFPEAFGLVALEGISCGTLPIITNHSGLKDVLDILSGESGIDMEDYRLRLDSYNVVADLSSKVVAVINMDPAERAIITKALTAVPRSIFSWRTMAEEHLRLLTG